MQTKEQAREKYEEMLVKVMEMMRNRFDRLWDCGALNHEAYEDNYSQPKVILGANLEEAAHQYGPITTKQRMVVKNLAGF